MDSTQIVFSPEALEALKVFSSQSPLEKWLPVLAAIGGAIVGGLVSYLPNKCLEAHKRQKESEAVRNALVTEIRSIMEIIQERNYSIFLEKEIRSLKKSGGVITLSVRVPEHYSRVYQAQVSRIGLLDPVLATKVITFHQLIDAVVQDVSPGGLIAEKGGDLEDLKTLRDIFCRALAKAHEILAEEDARMAKQCG